MLAKRVVAFVTWDELLRADLAIVRCIFAGRERVMVLITGRLNG